MTKRLGLAALAALVMLVLFAPSAHATTYNSPTCSRTDVNNTINLTSNGDTVIVPAGNCVWSTGIFPNNSITLQGTGTPGCEHLGSHGDGTCTYIENGSNAASWQPLLQWSVPTNGTVRITGFTFDGNDFDGSGSGTNSNGYLVILSGNSANVRVDNNVWHMDRSRGMIWSGSLRGVVDHNTFHLWGFGLYGLFTKAETWLGGDESYCAGYSISPGCGDTSWSSTLTPGSSDEIYVEDNTFTNHQSGFTWANDGDMGERVAFRHNTYNDALWANHGTETDGRPRGALWAEVYANQFNITNISAYNAFPSIVGTRSGSGIIFDNTVTQTNGANVNRLFDMATLRNDDSSFRSVYVWGRCGIRSVTLSRSGTTVTGTSTWSGVHTSGTVITITGAGSPFDGTFTATQGVDGDHFTYTTTSTGATSSSGFLQAPWDGNTDSQGYRCLDQAGAGPGITKITGGFPSPIGGNDEALMPIYVFNNQRDTDFGAGTTYAQTDAQPSDAFSLILENRDYYNQKASFTGTQGIGRGTLASRPATCTTGVGYWATDQGEWDSTHAGNDGQLYKCTSTNTWTLYYKPYTYPHPLVGGGPPPPPPAPIFLRILNQRAGARSSQLPQQ